MDINKLDKGQLLWYITKEIVKMTETEIAENDIPYEIALIIQKHYSD